MAVAPPSQLLDEITDFLASSPPPQAIIDFKPSDVLRDRSLELLQRNREGSLSEAERAEMADFIKMDHFMTILKAKARLRLSQS
jgi:hypothetical protein